MRRINRCLWAFVLGKPAEWEYTDEYYERNISLTDVCIFKAEETWSVTYQRVGNVLIGLTDVQLSWQIRDEEECTDAQQKAMSV